jgi:hypothetical protein
MPCADASCRRVGASKPARRAPLATFLEDGWSQWVVATLGQSLLLEAYEAGFVRGDQIKQNKSPV